MATQTLDLKNAEDIITIQNITNVIKHDIVNPFFKEKEEISDSADCTSEYEKIFNLTSLSLKMFANSYYKSQPFLEVSDIEQIKESLNNYPNEDTKVKEFKTAIIKDLTIFQQQIKSNHVQRLAELTKQKQFLDKQVRILDFEKNKLIMDRLSKVSWPYDHKTKEYDAKIAKLQMQAKKFEQKIEELKSKKPTANEKDIILYQMALREKIVPK